MRGEEASSPYPLPNGRSPPGLLFFLVHPGKAGVLLFRRVCGSAVSCAPNFILLVAMAGFLSIMLVVLCAFAATTRHDD